MCRNITELRGLEPPATRQEIEAAARQYVRKVSGISRPGIAVAGSMEAAALEIAARAKAAEFKKSDFALTYAIEDRDWVAPRYLTEGIAWLAADDVPPADPVLAVAMAIAVAADAAGGDAPHG